MYDVLVIHRLHVSMATEEGQGEEKSPLLAEASGGDHVTYRTYNETEEKRNIQEATGNGTLCTAEIGTVLKEGFHLP